MPSPLPRRDRWVQALLPSPTTAAFPEIQAGRLPHYLFRGLLSVHSRYGLHTRRVALRPSTPEASAMSFPTSPLRLLPTAATFVGWDSHPLEFRAFSRRTELIRLDYRLVWLISMFRVVSSAWAFPAHDRRRQRLAWLRFLGGSGCKSIVGLAAILGCLTSRIKVIVALTADDRIV